MIEKARRWFRQLGPGLITGAADDDPSGIATYSQAGAQFGYQLGWTVVLTYPLMVGIQMVSARMGRVTGRGLASNIRAHFPAARSLCDRRDARHRQHDQRRSRHRGDGRGSATCRRRRRARPRGGVRGSSR
jgi:hypothetical protein